MRRMSLAPVAAAMARLRKVLAHTPAVGQGPDTVAHVRWVRGLEFICEHDNGAQVGCDMPEVVGGGGGRVTPGWLFRAGLAACTATTVAMRAGEAGIDLTRLEIDLGTTSDARSLLDMKDDRGGEVRPGFYDIRMSVKVAARGIEADRLRALVAEWIACSPSQQTVAHGSPIAIPIDVEVA